MATVQSGPGRIIYQLDMLGAGYPHASTAAGAQAFSQFALNGDLADTDTGVVPLAKAGGWARLTSTNEDGKGITIGTSACFSPVLNAPMSIETRLEMQALTTTLRVCFVGFCSANAADAAEPLTSTGTTFTPVATDYAGFLLDSQLTALTYWHMPYRGGAATSPTVSTDVICSQAAVAAASDILRVEVGPDGTVRWILNGKVEKELADALDTTTLLAAFVGCFSAATTATDIDVNYIRFEANRDWTV